MRRMDGEARPGTEMSYAGSDVVRKEWEPDQDRDSVNQGEMVKCEGGRMDRTWSGRWKRQQVYDDSQVSDSSDCKEVMLLESEEEE